MTTTTPFWDDTTQDHLHWLTVRATFAPLSAAGQRRLRHLQPFRNGEQVEWHQAVADWQALRRLPDRDARKRFADRLRALPDVADCLRLIEQGGGLRAADFFDLKQFLWHGRELEGEVDAHQLAFPWWGQPAWETLLRLLQPDGELVPSFAVADIADSAWNELRTARTRLENDLLAGKKAQGERLRATYKRPPNRDGRYVWDRQERDLLARAGQDPDLQLVQETPFELIYSVLDPGELAPLRTRHEQVLEDLADCETRLLRARTALLHPHVQELTALVDQLARLDLAFAAAQVAEAWGSACTPVWVTGATPWQIQSGWHPVVRTAVESRGGTYTPLDLVLQPGVGVITGPNMGGKTIVLHTVGLLQALAQHGLPVPAVQFDFHPVERIGLSGGDEQDARSGLSSFGGEMLRLAHLLHAPGRALLLLDEVGRTTNPTEGEALAAALVEHLLDTGHTALFASHFPGVVHVPGLQTYRVAGLCTADLPLFDPLHPAAALAQLQHAMDYRLLPCPAGEVPHEAVRLAAVFGLPDDVIRRAEQRLTRTDHREEGR